MEPLRFAFVNMLIYRAVVPLSRPLKLNWHSMFCEGLLHGTYVTITVIIMYNKITFNACRRQLGRSRCSKKKSYQLRIKSARPKLPKKPYYDEEDKAALRKMNKLWVWPFASLNNSVYLYIHSHTYLSCYSFITSYTLYTQYWLMKHQW